MSAETPFEWLPDYDVVLEGIASTDTMDTEWPKLRDILKYKIDKNVDDFLTQSSDTLPAPPIVTSPRPMPSGGLKLPPFPPRPRNPHNPLEAPKSLLSEDEAKAHKEVILRQLDEFEGPPFTIQRVCELCLYPKKHYRMIGKYLRAVEKTLLVTSTWDAFPVPADGASRMINSTTNFDSVLLTSAPPTPMFSPIPFLHDDARRSKSRSPPPSPLALPALATGGTSMSAPNAGSEGAEPPVLGLVDELDDPSPGHLSDHPQPLSSTTTVDPKPAASLAERFVKSTEEQEGKESSAEAEAPTPSEEMAVDDPEKENKAD
ncbi:PPP4R2-domain-containing protein [Phanerochaete sordida]|uniref:PPP4R2-domain-containing protein n=1 Tax=Phanerochaete sordida TaxID=48140 RepID=A0A9P3LAL3_9APHY|nr:PPP4R2-domain-containing protein [Phanerochaete sordida]